MKKLVTFVAAISMLLLAGCPGTVNPGKNANTKYGDTGGIWGLPLVHAVTAGFNGTPSEVNDTGPASGPKGK